MSHVVSAATSAFLHLLFAEALTLLDKYTFRSSALVHIAEERLSTAAVLLPVPPSLSHPSVPSQCSGTDCCTTCQHVSLTSAHDLIRIPFTMPSFMYPVPRTQATPRGAWRQTSWDREVDLAIPNRIIVDANDRHVVRLQRGHIGSVGDGECRPAKPFGVHRCVVSVHSVEGADAIAI